MSAQISHILKEYSVTYICLYPEATRDRIGVCRLHLLSDSVNLFCLQTWYLGESKNYQQSFV